MFYMKRHKIRMGFSKYGLDSSIIDIGQKHINSRAIGYTRVSTLSQYSNSSLFNQSESIKNYCIRNNLELVNIFSDSASGTSENPQLSKALNLLYQPNDINILIVSSFDRIFRSMFHMAKLLNEFKSKNLKIISIREDFELGTPIGDLLINIISSISQFELNLIKDRVYRGKIAKKELFYSNDPCVKLFLGGSIPYGYKVDKIVQNSKNFKVLVQDEAQQQVIFRINSELKQNKSLQEIADSLNKDEIMTQRDKKWSKTQVWRIIKDFNV